MCTYYLCAKREEEAGQRNYVWEHGERCVPNKSSGDAIYSLWVNVQPKSRRHCEC